MDYLGGCKKFKLERKGCGCNGRDFNWSMSIGFGCRW